jgi:hypothetical protein
MIGHEHFDFQFMVKAGKLMLIICFPWDVHLGATDELKAQSKQGSQVLGGG